MNEYRAAVIVDVVDSRQHLDRADTQRRLAAAFVRADGFEPALSHLSATVGDESQGMYSTVEQALRATLYLRLILDEGIDCRFGIGWGEHREIGQSDFGVQVDGSAWWSAREALDEAHRREKGNQPTVRSWLSSDVVDTSMVNAYLLTRDQIISTMTPRSKRLTAGLMEGLSQRKLAHAEGITQPAVSQALRNSGAHNLVASAELLV